MQAKFERINQDWILGVIISPQCELLWLTHCKMSAQYNARPESALKRAEGTIWSLESRFLCFCEV